LSLREAVLLANASYGPDTITFAQGLASKTLTLARIGDMTAGPSALEIRPGSVVTIQGLTGASGITLAGGGAASSLRAFYVAPTGSLTLERLTLRDFRHKGGNGGTGYGGGGGAAGLGGVVFNEGTLTLRASTFTQNQAQGGDGGHGFFGSSP